VSVGFGFYRNMEGTYFFGEHLRWNLGWSNPNQAGAFIAMFIPWLWVLGRRGSGGSGKALGCGLLLVAAELVLWFLVCKTYSRGALMALGVAGGIYLLWCAWLDLERRGWAAITGNRPSQCLFAVRIAGIGALLWGTEFLSRIEPEFISQDASAGNRLALWKGGVQMIAAAPWRGWGAGQAGSGFGHWFQNLDAHEKYAGMVNSYLHVGVEYGLPVLALAMTVATAFLATAFMAARVAANPASGDGITGRPQDGESSLPARKCFTRSILLGAGTSLLVFLIANVFSTLWIFKNLWWLPAADCLLIAGLGLLALGRSFPKLALHGLAAGAAVALVVAVALVGIGRSIPSDVRIVLHRGDNFVAISKGSKCGQVLLFPESSVLGEDWGKEIRRLAASSELRGREIVTPTGDAGGATAVTCPRLQTIVACGSRFSEGFTALLEFPDAHLILLHPVGKPEVPDALKGRVSVILPMLDTRNSGRNWKAACKQRGWESTTSPGVGQDVRLVWPDVLVNAI
jgi:hypothetical protein